MKNQAQNINHKRSSVGPDFEWTPTLWGGGTCLIQLIKWKLEMPSVGQSVQEGTYR